MRKVERANERVVLQLVQALRLRARGLGKGLNCKVRALKHKE
jgi:hypothetical protein